MALLRKIPLVYVVICLLAVGVFLAGLPFFAGEDADPLAGVFMFLVALPWVLLLDLFGELPLWATVMGSIAGMAINYLILRRLFSSSPAADHSAPE